MQPLIINQWQTSAELRARQHRAREHMRRCAQLPPLREGEAERLVNEYLASKPVTVGPSPGSFAGNNNLSIGWGSR